MGDKVNKISLRDRLLRANSHDEIKTIWTEVERARANTMSDKTFKRCQLAATKRFKELSPE